MRRFVCRLVVRFRRADSKVEFMKWGWIDLIASIPNIEILRWGRMLRVLRVIRVLRGIRSFQKILALMFRHKVKSGVGTIVTTAGLLVTFASIAILVSETDSDSNIKTAGDAIWWSVTTITTVGYGDKYPVTTEGRLIAMALMISGVGLFGTLSGVVASVLLGASDESNPKIDKLIAEVQLLQQKIDNQKDGATWK
ncbi:MAG: Ion transport 2 domain protein [Verrucomicrobiales bacterium]|nr:Ion transport 2 domain protein [Verrucomicrobiales bacterium]